MMIVTYDLEKLKKKFSNFSVDHNNNDYTMGKAPHKPLLFIDLILLEKNGLVDLNNIDLSNVKLRLYLADTWRILWDSLDKNVYRKAGSIIQPLFWMKNEKEKFWFLEKNENIGKPSGLSSFYDKYGSIRISSDVVSLIKSNRNDLLNSLLNGGYFSDSEKKSLASTIKNIDESFEFEEKMDQELKGEFSMERPFDFDMKKRSPAFRRSVLLAYEGKCAVCGLKIETSSDISVIDAAHILPFSEFGIDDCRNGLALCKLHHWMFDRGLISVNEKYRIIVSKSIVEEFPTDAVHMFENKPLLLPQDGKRLPAKEALRWHRVRFEFEKQHC